MGDLTLQHVVLRIAALLLIAGVNGFAIAALACLLGDPGPRQDGRLTLSPWPHADPIGGLSLVLFAMGWIRPIVIDPTRLRIGKIGLPVIILGASGATLALARLARLIRPFVLTLLPDTASETFFVFVETLTQLCISFTLLNLLPLPQLTGQHWLVAVQPHRREAIGRLGPWCVAPMAMLIISGAAARCLAPAQSLLDRLIVGG
jgi:hypothetical protein